MHHVALDWPRPHDRDLDDEIVKFLRLEPRQHTHLRAALDLEDAERVGTGQHLVNGGLFGRDRGKVEPAAVMLIEPAADGEPDADYFCGMMRTHNAGKAVAIRDRDRLIPERRR